MSAAMVARAAGQGLIDQPPHFALSRVYDVIARGVVTTLFDPIATVITVTYTGRPCIAPPCIGGPVLGVNSLDPDRYHPLVQTQSLHTGPHSSKFYFGIGGIVDYFALNVTLTDPLAPTGTGGNGVLAPGGLVFDATECFNNMKSEAALEDIMVVNLVHLGGNPTGTIQDPTTGAPLSLGDLFAQAEILLHAVADQLTAELLIAEQPTIPSNGAINVLDPPIILPSVTTLIT